MKYILFNGIHQPEEIFFALKSFMKEDETIFIKEKQILLNKPFFISTIERAEYFISTMFIESSLIILVHLEEKAAYIYKGCTIEEAREVFLPKFFLFCNQIKKRKIAIDDIYDKRAIVAASQEYLPLEPMLN